MEALSEFVSESQLWLFETVVQPVLFHLGMGNLLEDGYAATLWLLAGLFQIGILVALIGPLQRWRPVEPVTDRAEIRVDILYTLIHRLGLFRLALFFTVDPIWDAFFGEARLWGFSTWQLDQIWPGVTDQAWVSLILYLIIFDAVDYLYHRAQHRYAWLWQLHALHHSQRQLTMWSDNRNHLLDDLLRDALIVLVSQLIGVPPAQFVAIVVLTQLVESLSHANLRFSFGPLGQRLLVGPRFHRRHHAIDYDATTPAGGYNFGVLLPIWDIVCRTARFQEGYAATGIHDQLPEAGARDYGRGFLRQQWLGIKRLLGRDRPVTSAPPQEATPRVTPTTPPLDPA